MAAVGGADRGRHGVVPSMDPAQARKDAAVVADDLREGRQKHSLALSRAQDALEDAADSLQLLLSAAPRIDAAVVAALAAAGVSTSSLPAAVATAVVEEAELAVGVAAAKLHGAAVFVGRVEEALADAEAMEAEGGGPAAAAVNTALRGLRELRDAAVEKRQALEAEKCAAEATSTERTAQFRAWLAAVGGASDAEAVKEASAALLAGRQRRATLRSAVASESAAVAEAEDQLALIAVALPLAEARYAALQPAE